MKLIKLRPSQSEPLQKFVDTYLATKKVTRAYVLVLAQWREFTGKPLAECTEYEAILWKNKLEAGDYAGNSIIQKINILKGLYSYLLKRGQVSMNIFEMVPLPQRDSNMKRPRKAISFESVSGIMSGQDGTDDTPENQAMFALLFCGLRISEVINLKVADCRFMLGEIQIQLRNTKNGDDAFLTLPDWAARPVVKYCQNCPRSGDQNVFQVSVSTLARRFKAACKAFGFDASPHDARATAITKLLADGVPLREVQVYARHRSPISTGRYDKNKYSTHKKLKY